MMVEDLRKVIHTFFVDIIHETVEAMVQCYQQEFPDTTMIVIKRPIAVYWGSMSVLDADLMCMRRLREQNKGNVSVSLFNASDSPIRAVRPRLEDVSEPGIHGASDCSDHGDAEAFGIGQRKRRRLAENATRRSISMGSSLRLPNVSDLKLTHLYDSER